MHGKELQRNKCAYTLWNNLIQGKQQVNFVYTIDGSISSQGLKIVFLIHQHVSPENYSAVLSKSFTMVRSTGQPPIIPVSVQEERF